MRNIKLVILSILMIFIFSNEVYAGVCKGYSVNSSSSTCNSMNLTITKPSELDGTYGSYFLRPGYRATNTKGNALALCLDPGLSRPSSGLNLNYIRELTNDNIMLKKGNVDFYDDGIYRIYQYFYNILVYQKNHGGLSRNFVNQHSSYFEYASRVWTYRHGFDYTDNLSAEYKNDAANFRTCSHYIDNNLFSGSSSTTENYCFGSHKELVKEYYNAVNKNYSWENPIKITTKSDVVTNNGAKYYVYKFKISFANDEYSFFDGTYSPGIHFGDINLPAAKFNLADLTVNGVSCTSSLCSNYSGGGDVTSGTEKEFIVELTEDQYNNFKNNYSPDGTVNVSMKYSYQHPLNIENLYTARYDLKNSYQRMLIIQNYVHEDIETIGKEPETISCEHTATGVYHNNLGVKVSTLSEFLANCDCTDVNKTLLTSSELTQYNNIEKCKSSSTDSYYGSINNCNNYEDREDSYYKDVLDNNYESYNLGYITNTTINDYCTEKCVEDINIYNLKGKYTTKAGMYFEFDEYPSLASQKRCTIDIDYNTWNTNYYNNLDELKKKYNIWQEAKAAAASVKTGLCNPHCCGYMCSNTCYDTLYIYDYSYEEMSIVDNTRLVPSTQTGYKTSCDSAIDWQVSTKYNNFLAQATKETAITNLKSDLKECNNRLYGATNNITAAQFYEFSQQLNYYYEQQYSNGKTVLNIERTNRYGIDDSKFNDTSSLPTETNNKSIGVTKQYSNLNVSGINNESIVTYINSSTPTEDIQRQVNYTVIYNRPYHKKYSETMTSTIVSYESGIDLKNYTELGYGYDTDATAIAQKGNKSYYVFSKLGDSNNKLFNNFKDNNYGGIVRMCDYEITNNILKTCENGYCDSKLNIVYRTVDPSSIDPNNRLSSGKGFSNWKTTNAQVVKKKIEEDAKAIDTYSPENLEYSFKLDSRTIAAIREENKDYKYDDWNDDLYECEQGNKCKSAFITKIEENKLRDSSNNQITNILKNINGRSTWKEIIDIGANKYTIDGKEVDLNS